MGSHSHRQVIATLLGLALLAIAPQALAHGRNDAYIGPIEQPPLEGFPPEEKIELYVHTQYHHDGSITIKIPVVNIFNVYLNCQNGHHIGTGYNAKGDTQEFGLVGLNVKHHSFKQSGIWQEDDSFVLKGTLPNHGSASGTLSVSANVGELEGEREGEKAFYGHCESGLLHWSAQRR